jgi:hypothetical protein
VLPHAPDAWIDADKTKVGYEIPFNRHLMDALDRVSRIAGEVGGVGLVVDAKPSAVGFYTRYGFEQMPDHSLHLFLPI